MEATAAQIHGKELIRLKFRGQTRNLVVLSGRDSAGILDTHAKVEAFNALHGTSLRVVPHDVADFALNVGETWRSLADCFGFVVDASIAFEKPGNRLGEEIVFSLKGEPKIVMATGRYEGEKGIALAALGLSARDIRKEGDSVVLDIPDDRLIPVPDFPSRSGWYLPHKLTGIPHGQEVGEKRDSRYLNEAGGPYVGLVVRSVDADGCELRQYVGACSKASWKYAVVAEVPEQDAGKINALLGSAPR